MAAPRRALTSRVTDLTTQGYQPDRPGFFVVPVDPKSNNDRCFVVMAAVKAVRFP